MTSLEHAAATLRRSTSVVVFTGAGVSAESGLPTFRSGANAMWKDDDVARYANPRGYRAHAADAWRWYCMRVQKAAEVEPNAGHLAIAEIERRVKDFVLVTQNVDGLHQRAGSRNVVELHGSLRQVRCFDCGVAFRWPPLPAEPRCKRCGGLLRPNVVFFEEQLPVDAIERAREVAERCDVFIAAGTSNLVWPAREIPDYARSCGADVFIVNVDMEGQTPASEHVLHLVGQAGDVLPRLVAATWSVA
ncbi:MAG TPA: NAD-dependent deacylase [Gemmatimonadaceae bacterium]|nr:NAD-dependent deacylase [Gemmatimonadaceae bacterium]